MAAFFAHNGIATERVEVVGKDDGRGFAQLEDPTVARHVLERHDENAGGRLDWAGSRVCDGSLRPDRNAKRERSNQCHDLTGLLRVPLTSASFSTHVGSPVPRQATTSVCAPTLNMPSIFVNAAA